MPLSGSCPSYMTNCVSLGALAANVRSADMFVLNEDLWIGYFVEQGRAVCLPICREFYERHGDYDWRRGGIALRDHTTNGYSDNDQFAGRSSTGVRVFGTTVDDWIMTDKTRLGDPIEATMTVTWAAPRHTVFWNSNWKSPALDSMQFPDVLKMSGTI